jgi:hypothetical protein
MSPLRNIWIGITAGLAGSAAMHGFRLVWEAAVAHNSRHTIFGLDREADVNGARRAHGFFSDDVLPEALAGRLGIAMHYGLGATFGVFYALSRARRLSGATLGALLWLGADEIPISVCAISDPFAKSISSHAGALVSHLLFGITVTRTLRAVKPIGCASRYLETKYGYEKTQLQKPERMLAGI